MSRPPRLLIVDDEPVHRASVTRVLGSAGWAVDEAADGAAALRAIEATRYAVVLLGMPGADGFEVARVIRAGHGADPAVPILAVTALSGPDVMRRVEDAGMDGHIARPIPPAALIERLARWWPVSTSPARARLAAAFGAAEIGALDESFRAQLVDALARIDQPGVAALAHRIAGVAGTLGFTDVHDAWLALSEGAPGARRRAANAAHRTLRALTPGEDRAAPG